MDGSCKPLTEVGRDETWVRPWPNGGLFLQETKTKRDQDKIYVRSNPCCGSLGCAYSFFFISSNKVSYADFSCLQYELDSY